MSTKIQMRNFLAVIGIVGLCFHLKSRYHTDPQAGPPPVPVTTIGSAPKLSPVTQPIETAALPAPRSRIDNLMKTAVRLHLAVHDEAAEADLKRQALEMTDEERAALTNRILDVQAPMDDRWAFLNLLAMGERRSIPNFVRILKEPITTEKAQITVRDAEVSLRISAVEALDEYANDDSSIAPTLQETAIHAQDRSLQLVAMIALRGADQHRPGKLKRFIDKSLQKGSP